MDPYELSKIGGPAKAHQRQMEQLQTIVQGQERRDNPAKWAYERLGKYIQDFEADLDEEHEIGARLVSFGQAITFHIQDVGYYGPDIINFDGVNENGEHVKLIQNISQLSVLLVAMKKIEEKPRRIGFIWDEYPNQESSEDD